MHRSFWKNDKASKHYKHKFFIHFFTLINYQDTRSAENLLCVFPHQVTKVAKLFSENNQHCSCTFLNKRKDPIFDPNTVPTYQPWGARDGEVRVQPGFVPAGIEEAPNTSSFAPKGLNTKYYRLFFQISHFSFWTFI